MTTTHSPQQVWVLKRAETGEFSNVYESVQAALEAQWVDVAYPAEYGFAVALMGHDPQMEHDFLVGKTWARMACTHTQAMQVISDIAGDDSGALAKAALEETLQSESWDAEQQMYDGMLVGDWFIHIWSPVTESHTMFVLKACEVVESVA